MSRALSEWVDRKGRAEKTKHERPPLSREERLALHRLRREARAAGSLLQNRGRGGLPPSLALAVMRRDEFTCKICGEKGNKDNGGIGLHHKGGIIDSDWLDNKGHKNDLNNLVTCCDRDHGKLHEKAREEGKDSTQVEPKGDR